MERCNNKYVASIVAETSEKTRIIIESWNRVGIARERTLLSGGAVQRAYVTTAASVELHTFSLGFSYIYLPSPTPIFLFFFFIYSGVFSASFYDIFESPSKYLHNEIDV